MQEDEWGAVQGGTRMRESSGNWDWDVKQIQFLKIPNKKKFLAISNKYFVNLNIYIYK